MIKAIFFDFDGVLTLNPNGYTIVPENIHKRYPELSLDVLLEKYGVFSKDLQRGEKTHYDIWDEYCKNIGVDINASHLEELFLETPMNEEMIALARSLKEEGFTVGVITNNTTERLNTILKAHALESFFDPLIVSSAIGLVKSEPGIFEEALRHTGCDATESFFIDNQEKNLVVPKQLGMHTYFHDDTTNDVQALAYAIESLSKATA